MTIGRADINHVLMQMRQVKTQMQPVNHDRMPIRDSMEPPTARNPVEIQPDNPRYPTINPDKNVPNFSDMFESAVNQVNAKQQVSSQLQTRYIKGDPRVDLPEVMIAAQKSSVAFTAMTQVRNKFIDTYKEIMNMPV